MSLLENGYDSFAESFAYVERAATDPTRWKFAVLDLVHAAELLLKQRLLNEHELLVWARRLVAAQRVQVLVLDGVEVPRTPWGQEKWWNADYMDGRGQADFCRDCAAALGEQHGPGCVLEECPNCGGQLITCECDWADSDYWALWGDEYDENEPLDGEPSADEAANTNG